MRHARTARLLALLIGLGFAFAAPARAEKTSHALPEEISRPLRAHVSFRLLDVTKIQETSGEVSAIIEIRQAWQDPTLRFDAVKAGRQRLDYAGEDAKARIGEIWTPALITEGQIGEARSSASSISIYSDGRVQLIEQIAGDFRFRTDLSAFPFDTQRVSFSFVSQYHPSDDLVFVVNDSDRAVSSYADRLTISDWTAQSLTFRNESFYGWNARPFSRLSVEIDMSRNWPRYVLRIFVPFVAVLSVSLFILWGAVSDRPSITYSALLALAALGFTFEASFPGSMSVNSPIALMISIGYFYLIITLLTDLFMESSRFPLRARFPHLPEETRQVMRHLLPGLFVIICGCVILRSLA